jgi:hypothetical protein
MRSLLIGTTLCLLVACGAERPEGPENSTDAPAPAVFTEIADQVGLDFTHFNGMHGEHYIMEHTGGGAALLDYDNDGDLDLYLVQGDMLGPDKDVTQAILPPPGPLPLPDRLYRNDLVLRADGSRDLRFTDVTEESGLRSLGYGMGATAGDYDNDGWVDLYVTNWGANQMWRNNGDGTFTDTSDKTGTADPGWSTSAAFVDYDHDSRLDLYVANYLVFDYTLHVVCPSPSSATDYCGPAAFSGQADRLYHNRGDGTFEDVSDSSKIGSLEGKGLGIAATDFDGDGLIDIYVANDKVENILWFNNGDGTFRDEALLSGCALNREGRPESSMGVDAADFDGDGDDDLFLTHLTRETNTIYVNEPGGVFNDKSTATGLGPASWKETGWGTAWLDYDNDGWLDIFVANGSIAIVEEQARAGDPFPMRQANRLFQNDGAGGFADVSEKAGPALEILGVSRGAAFGDVDNDGDTDILIVNNGGAVNLLLNEVGASASWLGLRLIGTDGGRDMLGARAEIVLADGRSLWRRARSDGSYCASNDPRVLAGLGRVERVERVRVHWPDGSVEEWTEPATGRYTTLVQGTGRTVGES